MKYVLITEYTSHLNYSHHNISVNEVNQIEMSGDEMGSRTQWFLAIIVEWKKKKKSHCMLCIFVEKKE